MEPKEQRIKQRKIFITTSLLTATDLDPSSALVEKRGKKAPKEGVIKPYPRENDNKFITDLPQWFQNHRGKKIVRVKEIHFIPHTKYSPSEAEITGEAEGDDGAVHQPADCCAGNDCNCDCKCCNAGYISVGNKILEAQYANKELQNVSVHSNLATNNTEYNRKLRVVDVRDSRTDEVDEWHYEGGDDAFICYTNNRVIEVYEFIVDHLTKLEFWLRDTSGRKIKRKKIKVLRCELELITFEDVPEKIDEK
jgi:hypothetical protein